MAALDQPARDGHVNNDRRKKGTGATAGKKDWCFLSPRGTAKRFKKGGVPSEAC